MSILTLIGGGMLMWSIGALIIKTSRFTKIKDVASGLTIYTDKETGIKYVQTYKNGYLMKLDNERSGVLNEQMFHL